MAKKFLLFLVSLLAGIGLFVWISRIVGWRQIKDALLVFTGWQGMLVLLLTLLMALVGTWKWKEILKGGGINVPFKNLIAPYLGGFSIMFLAPILVWGGEVFRSYILKKRDAVSWSKGMASVIIERILEWTANLAVIFLGGVFFFITIGFPRTAFTITLGAIFLILFAGIVFFYFKCTKKETIVGFLLGHDHPLAIEKEIFEFFKMKSGPMWRAIILSLLKAGVMYARAFLLILFLGKSISPLPVLSILGFTYLAAMVPIPTALGSHEALQIFAFESLGLGASAATAFTMIIRGAEVFLALAGTAVLLRWGMGFLKSFLWKNTDDWL